MDKVNYYIGIDLGGTNAKAGVVDSNGKVISVSHKKIVNLDQIAVMNDLLLCTYEALKLADKATEDITAIGIGSPGLLDYEKGIVKKAANFPSWDHVKICQYITEKTGVKSALENDGNAAAAAEYWVGSGRGHKSLCMMTLGTGIGSGFCEDGRILHGSFDMGVECGHMIVERKGRRCNCGQLGCLEQYASASAVVKIAQEKFTSSNDQQKQNKIPEFTAKDVCDLYKKGDKVATEVLEEVCEYIAIGCINLCRCFDPEVIVMTGGLANAGPELFDLIRKHFYEQTWTIMKPQVIIDTAKAGEHSGIIGAAMAAKVKFT